MRSRGKGGNDRGYSVAHASRHDLRHTWASWHIQEGTPLHVLQELGGWSTPEMVQKYAHLSSEHLAQWVDRQPVVLTEVVPISDTFFTAGKEKGPSISA